MRTYRVQILSVNDIYQPGTKGTDHGGFARVHTLLAAHRPPDSQVLFTVNGDFLGGYKLAEDTKGAVGIRLLDAMRADLVVPGNHEFDYGPERLMELVASSSFPWIVSNMKWRADSGELVQFPGMRPFHVSLCGPDSLPKLKVGWFGLITASTRHTSSPGDRVVFESIVDTAKAMVKLLRNTHACDVVVALTHLSLAEDNMVASSVSGIDLILGGHDHQPYAYVTDSTLVFKAGQNGYWFGKVVLDVQIKEEDEKTIKVFHSFQMISTFGVEPDPRIAELATSIERSLSPVEEKKESEEALVPLFRIVAHPLDTRTQMMRSRATSGGNTLADIFMVYSPDVQFGLINGGFIRGDKMYKPGKIVYEKDIDEELPFPRFLAVVDIEEKYLYSAIEEMLSKAPNPVGSFPHLSKNCRVLYDEKLPPLSRILEFTIGGVLLSRTSSTIWRFCSTDFVLSGGDGCLSFKKAVLVSKSTEIVKELVKEHFRKTKVEVFEPDVERRVRELQESA